MQQYRTIICSVKLQLEDCKKQLQSKIKKFEQAYYIKHNSYVPSRNIPRCRSHKLLVIFWFSLYYAVEFNMYVPSTMLHHKFTLATQPR